MRPLRQRTGVLVLAFGFFVGTMSLRFFATPEDAVLTLLTVPVAVIAFEFGWRVGVVSAMIAIVWVVIWNQLHLTALGYFARGATYVLTALIVGFFADRLRAAQVAAVESGRRVAELQRERQDQAEAAAAERARLARDVHDVIAHSVSVMTIQSTAARRVIDRDPERAAGALEAIETTGRDALAEMRRFLSVLRPSAGEAVDLVPQRGIDDLDTLAEQVRSAGLEVTVRYEGERTHVPAALDLSIYRIAQEALTNTLKHAAATSAAVVVRFGGGSIEVECSDDGIGAAAAANGGGHGLMGMRERATMLGGVLDTGPSPGGGYRVRARLPLAGA